MSYEVESQENGTEVVMENDLKGEDSFCSHFDLEVIKGFQYEDP